MYDQGGSKNRGFHNGRNFGGHILTEHPVAYDLHLQSFFQKIPEYVISNNFLCYGLLVTESVLCRFSDLIEYCIVTELMFA